MAVQTIWQEEMQVKSSDTDFQKRLKLSSFFIWMQDIASLHADHLGVGYEGLRQWELAWVLSRKKVRFFDFPEMGETVTVKTWPKGIQQKIFFMRDHQMFGSGGRLLATSTSAYILVSSRARRMVPASALPVPLVDNGGLSALDETLEKIAPAGSMTECFHLRAGYSMVDIMQHVNNARYIDWISDCFGMEDYQTRRPTWLQINYLNEVLPGEEVSVQRGLREDHSPAQTWYIAGVKQPGGVKAFEAEMGWE